MEINDAQIALLALKRSGHILTVSKIAYEDLPAETIVKGVLKNPSALKAALLALKKRAGWKSPYVVAALPENLIYLADKSFPNLEREQLQEAITLNLVDLLPGKPEQIYWGWQEFLTDDKKKIVTFASARKDLLEPYLKSFAEANLIPIAMEPSSLAAARAFGQKLEAVLVVAEKSCATVVIIKEGAVQFAAGLSVDWQDKKAFFKAIGKILNFYRAENPEAKIKLILAGSAGAAELGQELANHLRQTVALPDEEAILKDERIKSPIVLGAAARGLLAEKDDTNLSLLPVGTQAAYEEKAALHFFGGITNITAAVCLLFLLMFYGFFGFLIYLRTHTAEQMAALTKTKTSARLTDIQKQAAAVNPKLELMQNLLKSQTAWSPIFTAVKNAAGEGIGLTSLTWGKQSDQLSLSGNAQSREALAAFKDGLNAAGKFSAVDLASTNLNESQNINFVINLKIKPAEAK